MLETMRHTAKAILPRFGHLSPDSVMVDLCREHIAELRAATTGQSIPSWGTCAWHCSGPRSAA